MILFSLQCCDVYLGHCVLTSVFLVKAVLYLRYLLLFLTSTSALLLASPSSAGKIIKNSGRSHNLLLSYESRMWPSIFGRRNLSHNWKSSSPGRREPENVVIYPISSVFLDQGESPLQCLWKPLSLLLKRSWVKEKVFWKIHSQGTVVGARDAFWSQLCHLEERLPCTFL